MPKRVPKATPKRGLPEVARDKGLMRSLVRIGTRFDMSPPVARKLPVKHEPTLCERCGSAFVRKTWRRQDEKPRVLGSVKWAVCPACRQVQGQVYNGRVEISGTFAPANVDAIRRRVENVARRAAYTQPERKLVAADWTAEPIEILTTSQKLAHRIAHELRKAFGGVAHYGWKDDGLLRATWHRDLPGTKHAGAQ